MVCFVWIDKKVDDDDERIVYGYCIIQFLNALIRGMSSNRGTATLRMG